MADPTDQAGYSSQAQKIRRCRYADTNIAIAPVQSHFYCVRRVDQICLYGKVAKRHSRVTLG